mmetsp:Transcript_59936/g.112815  ORF Transcript_59936/g.112815 Transcript_59936/m.112815 type:complete len:472 (+) Transcript_59936:55-1470(+)
MELAGLPELPDMKLAPIDTLVEVAVEQAGAKAESVMEAVMREAMRMIRAEMHAKVEEVAEATVRLNSTCARAAKLVELNHPDDRLATLLEAQVELKKEIADHRQQLAVCVQEQEELRKRGREQDTQVEQVKADQFRYQHVLLTLEKLTNQGDEQLVQIRSDIEVRAELESIKGQGRETSDIDVLATLVSRQVSQSSHANESDHAGKQLPNLDLDVRVSQMVGECITEQLSHMRAQVEDMRAELSESSERDSQSTHASEDDYVEKQMPNLRAIVSQMVCSCMRDQFAGMRALVHQVSTELIDVHPDDLGIKNCGNRQGSCSEAIDKCRPDSKSALAGEEDHIDKQIAKSQLYTSQMVGERMSEQLAEIRAQIQEMRVELAERSAQPDVAVGSDSENWEAIKEAAFSEMHRLGEEAKDHVDMKISELLVNLPQMIEDRESTLWEATEVRESLPPSNWRSRPPQNSPRRTELSL